jgi:DNA-binding transcriptional LysR family regulator
MNCCEYRNNHPMDRLKAMQAFVHIADEGSLTAAARSLGTSLPAVVRLLAAYEAALGVRLVNRTTRRSALTEDGRRHLERCRQALAAVHEAEAALRADAAAPTGLLTVTAPVLFGQMYVAPVVTEFVRLHPQTRCNLVLLDRIVNLLEEGIDVGVRIGELDDSSLVARQIGSVRRVVVAAPALLRGPGRPRHPRELTARNCIRMAGAAPTWGDFQEGGKRFRVPVRGNLEFNHVLPAVQACAAGAGFGLFLSYQVAPYLADGTLKIVLEDFELPPRPISLVVPHARLLPTRTRAFIELVRTQVTQFRGPHPEPSARHHG